MNVRKQNSKIIGISNFISKVLLDKIKMKYLPFESITYETNLDSKEILKRINEEIEPIKKFRMSGVFSNYKHKPYEGYINNYSFRMSRIMEYQNSFTPIIKGVIKNNLKGTKINITMELHPFILILMCSLPFIIGIIFVISDYVGIFPFGLNALMSLLTTFLVYLIMIIAFKFESRKSKEYLFNLFEAKIEK